MKTLFQVITPFTLGYVLIWGSRNIQLWSGYIEIGFGVISLAIVLFVGFKTIEKA